MAGVVYLQATYEVRVTLKHKNFFEANLFPDMTKLKLSVIMATYNHRQYLNRAVDAIVTQSRPPDEFIILDDGSRDQSASVIRPYVQKYPYIRFIQHETNQGFFTSWNEMQEMVTGDYVYSCAADDRVLPGFFDKAMSLAEQNPQAGAVLGKLLVENADGISMGCIQVSRWREPSFITPSRFLDEYLKLESPGHALGASSIYKRDALKDVGNFREELGPWCDHFALRAIGLKYGVCYLPQFCAVWNLISNSLSQSVFGNRKYMLEVLNRNEELMLSEEFQKYFPEDYVKLWKSRAKLYVGIYGHPITQLVMNWILKHVRYIPFHRFIRFCLKSALGSMTYIIAALSGRITR